MAAASWTWDERDMIQTDVWKPPQVLTIVTRRGPGRQASGVLARFCFLTWVLLHR